MVAAWRAGADVVCMRRRSRQGEGWAKKLSAYAFYRLLSRLSHSKIPADTGDFRLMSPRAVNAMLSIPERCQYMKGRYAWVGMQTADIEYAGGPREERKEYR